MSALKKEFSYKGNLEPHLYMEDVTLKDNKEICVLKVHEDFSIGKFTVDTYLHGRCHLFALALNEITKAPVHLLCSPDYNCIPKDGDLSKGILISHVYIGIDSNLGLDAGGLSPVDHIKKTFEEFEETMYGKDESLDLITDSVQNISRIEAMMQKGYISKFVKGEKEAIVTYIRDMLKNECHKTHQENSPRYNEVEKTGYLGSDHFNQDKANNTNYFIK